MKRQFPWKKQVDVASYDSNSSNGPHATNPLIQAGAEENLPGITLANLASGNGKTCVQTASDNDSSWTNLGFSELLFQADKIWANSSQILPDNNDGLKSQFHDGLQDTMNIACWSKPTSQDILLTPENAIRAESEQINIEEKHPWGEEKNVPDKMLDNIGTLPNIELCDPIVEFAAVSTPLKENHSPDNSSSHDIDLTKSPQQKSRRTQISASQKPAQSKETPCLDHDLNTPMKQATKSDMLISQDSRAPSTSCSRRHPLWEKPEEHPTAKRKYVRRKSLNNTSKRNPPEAKATAKENAIGKRKCVRRKRLNKSCTTYMKNVACCSKQNSQDILLTPDNAIRAESRQTEMTAALPDFIKMAWRSSAVRDNLNEHICKDNNDGLKSKFQDDLQDASSIACCSNKEISQDTQLTPENAIRGESKEIASMQINAPCGEEESVSAKKLDDNGTPQNKEPSEPVVEFAAVSTQLKENQDPYYGSSHDIDLSKTPQQKPRRRRKHRPKIEGKPKRTWKPATPKLEEAKETPTVKRNYVQRKGLNNTYAPPTEMMEELTIEIMPESAKTSCRSPLNFDVGPRDLSSAGRESATAHLGKETGIVEQQTNVGLACDLNTSMKKASKKESQAPSTSSKENSPAKRKYARRKKLRETSAPTIEGTEELSKEMMTESSKTSSGRTLDNGIGARDESSAGIENATVHLSNDIDVAVQETNVGLAYHLKTSTEQASNNMSLSEDTQAPSTSSKSNPPPEAVAKENATTKRKYVRRKRLNESTPATEATATLTEPMVPDSTKMSCRSSGGSEKLNEHISIDNNSMKQVLDSYMSSPEDTQAPSTSPARRNPSVIKQEENATSKKKNVGKKGLSKSSTPTEITADLIELTMPESIEIEQRRSLYFDTGARDESSKCGQNLNVHNIKESSVVAEGMHAGLICDQSTSMKQTLYKFLSLPEDTQAPSTSSQSNSPGAKLNANSVENRNRRNDQVIAQDGHENSTKLLLKSVRQSNQNNPNISNSQISMIRLQMLGSKRKHSGTIRFADTSSMNEIGAYYNGFTSYQNMFRVQFPNLQKRRRSEKGKNSNASITSSVTTVQEAEPTFPQEVAQAHPYASSSSCWNFGFEYNAARVPTISEATGSIIDDAQAFEEFKLSSRRAQICDCESLTRIRNFETDPNYSAHQLCISDRRTFGDAERPQTFIDALVAETVASIKKKKPNKNKSVVFRSSNSTINEMQQCQNLALGNYHQSFGKPLDIACERRAIMQNVIPLSEQFSKLDIHRSQRPSLTRHNTLGPYERERSNIKI